MHLRAWALVLTVACGHVAADGAAVMTSRPTRPAGAKYYPPRDLLNCDGANFSSIWPKFRTVVTQYARNGFPLNEALYDQAAELVRVQQQHLLAASLKLPEVLVRQIPVTRLSGFCLFGFAAAAFILYRHDFNGQRLEAIEQALGWVEWPLDFSESSEWPTLWRHISLHLEEFRRRGDTSWSRELNYWGEDDELLPRPQVADVEAELRRWLRAGGTSVSQTWLRDFRGSADDAATALSLGKALGQGKTLRLLVLGHHLGSSMEPFSMLRAALDVGASVQLQASLFGQRHPKAGLACAEFGYCDENPALESWFKRYESRWLGVYDWMPDLWDEALSSLSAIVASSGFVSEADAVVCGGPAWFCVMLRILWPAPMLLYFAWPITPLVPPGFKSHVFAHVRALGQTSDPPAIFVVANWILAAQFALQVRMEVPVQRPHGIYVNQTYAPVPAPGGLPRVMVTRIGQWARVSGHALLETTWSFMEQAKREGRPFPFELVFLSIRLRGADTSQAVSYPDFAKFHACIFWPWDVMMLLFNELYTMEMPLLLPARRWMLQVVHHGLIHTEVNWWHLRASVDGGLPDPAGEPFPLPYNPWVKREDGLRPIAYWYELTDFMQFPHLTYFESFPNMLEQVRTLDIPTIRGGMRSFNQATFRESLAFYRRAALELLGSRRL